ncbi:CHAT domain-containing protein, partial [Candidatus Entotheonella palauensis]|uniref:CHAT domain-containing protein n=1 Tax=Candidatus Entotheonella palauensis TaxID=93172 RepID=UPI000B7E66EF
MTRITIQQTGSFEVSPNATVQFNHRPAYPITVTPPFRPTEEERLQWYFEEHLRFPFTRQVQAAEAARSVVTYGEALFEQLFKCDPAIDAEYQAAAQQGVERIEVDIIGPPAFHQLHWEALREPGREPLVLHGMMVRRTQARMPSRIEMKPTSTLRVLIVTARPHGRRDVGYRTISRPLIEGLRQIEAPVQVDIVRPGTYEALEAHLRASRQAHGVGYYQIIHFDLHGSVLTFEQLARLGHLGRHTYQVVLTDRHGRPNLTPPPPEAADTPKAYLFFEAPTPNDLDPAEARELAQLLREFQIPIAILNACQSGKQIGDTETSLGSHLLQAGIQTVLAMGYSVTVSAAALMMQRLYQSLLSHRNLLVAVGEARLALHRNKKRRAYYNQHIDLEDWLLPIVYQPQDDIPVELPLQQMTITEKAALLMQRQNLYQGPEPAYGFVGRDVDILQIEKRVLGHRAGKPCNLLLIRGMGGAGKTTLLHHLGAWWQRTGLVDEVFYFGYDVKAHTRDQIVYEMGRRLLNQEVPAGMTVSPDFMQYQSLQPDLQQALVAERLRARRHLLILDNLESITGDALAIPHTLPESDQHLLRGLLADLLEGQTLVLLGSRGRVGWLAEGPNAPLQEPDVYDLPGLDDEAASTLAERILERHVRDESQRAAYRQSEALSRLLKLLGGYPLPLEVVLANLAHQKPEDIVMALEQGDLTLDPEADNTSPEARTRSLIRCIEYSHSNLDPASQKLLLCLFPFTGVVWKDQLSPYIERLQQQAALADWPFDRWSEVLQTAQDWGLLTAQGQLPGFLSLQPTFPYFLKTRLERERADVRRAVEMAFHQFYDELSQDILGLLTSKEALHRQMGSTLARLEYENLLTALSLALENQVSILRLYAALSSYLNTVNDDVRGLALGELVLPPVTSLPWCRDTFFGAWRVAKGLV